MKTQTFGIEIETTGLGRRGTAEAIARFFGTTARYIGNHLDNWEVDMPDGEVVKASALMYIVPVCAFLLGLLLAWLVYRGGAVRMAEDLFYALCGLAACALGLAAVWAVDKKLRGAQKWQPRVVAVHKPEQPGEQ